MPTYEYACKSCGEHLEVVQSFKDDPLTDCPACAGPLRKVFQPIGIAFKGTGFYKNDSRSEKAKSGSATKEPAAAKESTAASSGESKSSSSGEKSSSSSDKSGSSGGNKSSSSGGDKPGSRGDKNSSAAAS